MDQNNFFFSCWDLPSCFVQPRLRAMMANEHVPSVRFVVFVCFSFLSAWEDTYLVSLHGNTCVYFLPAIILPTGFAEWFSIKLECVLRSGLSPCHWRPENFISTATASIFRNYGDSVSKPCVPIITLGCTGLERAFIKFPFKRWFSDLGGLGFWAAWNYAPWGKILSPITIN